MDARVVVRFGLIGGIASVLSETRGVRLRIEAFKSLARSQSEACVTHFIAKAHAHEHRAGDVRGIGVARLLGAHRWRRYAGERARTRIQQDGMMDAAAMAGTATAATAGHWCCFSRERLESGIVNGRRK